MVNIEAERMLPLNELFGLARHWIKALCVCIIGIVPILVIADESQDWPMWGYDAGRRGASTAAMDLPESLYLQWSRELPQPRRAWRTQMDNKGKLDFDVSYSPIVMGDRVFVASMTRDSLTAYSVDRGLELWRFYAEGPCRLAPAAWNGRVYFVSDDGCLYCLDAESGSLRWRFRAAPAEHRVLGNERVISMWPARGGPVILDGTIYFAAGIWPFLGSFVFALDAKTGKVLWENVDHATRWQRQPHGGAYAFAGVAPQGYLAAAGDRLVVSGGRALPSVFDRRDGTLLHSAVDGKDIGGYRVQIDGEEYFNHGLRFSLMDGKLLGEGSLEDANIDALRRRVEAVESLVDDEVFESLVAQDRLFLVTRKGTLYCFGSTPTDPVCHTEPQAPSPSLPMPADDREDKILQCASGQGGYALFLGVEHGGLMEKVVLHSDFHVVGVERDDAKVEDLRRRWDDAGLYGTRIALLKDDPVEVAYPPYIFSMIVVQDPKVLGVDPDMAALQSVYEKLRPYGGTAFFWTESGNATGMESLLSSFHPEKGRVVVEQGLVLLVREHGLPGAGEWTHQYADSAQTVMSQDQRVRPPFGPIWFGGPSNQAILPRHAAGPRPQVSHGRLVILGVESIHCRCVFTGRELWSREFPGIGHPFTNLELEKQWREGQSVYMTNQPGATYIGSPHVTLSDSLYLRHHGRIFRLNPATGETLAEWRLPVRLDSEDTMDWGHVSVCDDALIATMDPHVFRGGDLGSWGEDSWDGSSSGRLVVMNRFTGEVLWTRDAEVGFRHTAIAASGGRLFVNDLLSDKALDMARRRGREVEQEPRLYALDLQTGDVLWSVDSEVFGTFLSFSAEHDVLIECGSRDGRRTLSDEPIGLLVARRGDNGQVLWKRTEGFQGPGVVTGTWLISGRPGPAISLLTGEHRIHQHPLTELDMEWSYGKAYGCGMSNAGQHLLLFRSGSAGYADLEGDGGTGTLGGFKSGCTASLIPADGLLNAPDYTRTCTCSYQNQTSLGLIHMPEMEMWMTNWLDRGQGSIARVGINLGAPGNRRDSNGTLWLHGPVYDPPQPGPKMDVRLTSHIAPLSSTYIESVLASRTLEGSAENTLDGIDRTCWGIQSDTRGCFQETLRYELNERMRLNHVQMDWSGPEGTVFRVETSRDGEKWDTVYEGKKIGKERHCEVYSFSASRTKWIRLMFDSFPEVRKDERDRVIQEWVRVFEVRLGDLSHPEAYAYFVPHARFRRHTLQMHAEDGNDWIVSSGIRGLTSLLLQGVEGKGATYKVALYLAEPDDIEEGDRFFDILLQEQLVASDVDVVRMAGGIQRAKKLSFSTVSIMDSLKIELRQGKGSRLPPILCGIEIVRESGPSG